MDLRSRWFAVAVTSLFAAGVSAGTAWADIQVHVMNCTSQTVQAQAYDSKDSVKLLPASSDSYTQNGSGSLHCAGEGKGYCQMYVTILNASANCNVKGSNFNLDSGKWAVVTKFVKTSAA
ncbi:MAG TPA: hypothetical protein VGE98_12785, partial [Thermoanaerobaculia bacterium]